jgi:hypothetical protein
VFDDPSKAYMIAYFNGMNPKKPLLTGTVLRLPVLDPAILLPKSNIKSLLVRAQEAFEAGAFEQAAALSGKVLAEIPDHVKARRLADESSISLGMQLMEQERFSQALVQFKSGQRQPSAAGPIHSHGAARVETAGPGKKNRDRPGVSRQE